MPRECCSQGDMEQRMNTVVLWPCSVKNNTVNRNRAKGIIQTKLTLASLRNSGYLCY